MKEILLLLLLFTPLTTKGMKPIEMPSPSNPHYEAMAERIYTSICKQAHYLIGKTRPWEKNPKMRLLTESKHDEHGIRPNTGTLMGLTFLYHFGEYRPEIVGVDKDKLLSQYIVPMMSYVVATYDSIPTSDGHCWCLQWQSAHWAYALGKAAWYMGDDLPAKLKHGVCRIVKKEAERFYQVEPPYQVNYDTKAEENAWNSQIFHIASLLMPQSPDYKKWQQLLKKWVISSYITDADIKQKRTVDGVEISTFKGANIHDDYTLENHGIVHPDYMSAFMLSFQMSIDYKMIGRKIPEFLFYNIRPIYNNLKWFTLPDGGLTYPCWQDWRLFRNPDWVINHLFMAAFAQDPDAYHYASEALNCLELMQHRNSEGNIYNEDEYFFPSTQHDIMVNLSQSWQVVHFAEGLNNHYTPIKGVKKFKNGKIILNRSKKFLHSLCYGNRIMILPTLNSSDRLFDSYPVSGIGSIKLKGEKEYLKGNLTNIHMTCEKDAYHVEMTVAHGDAVEARYHINAYPDKLCVSETLVALKPCHIDYISTSEYGILNNRSWVSEKGYRILSWKDNSIRFNSTCGEEAEIDVSKFKLDQVDFKLKRKAGAFTTRYIAAKAYKRARGTDVLSLNYSREVTKYSQGDTISELHYIIR